MFAFLQTKMATAKGILQIRNGDKKIIDFVNQRIKEKNIKIEKIKKFKSGFDYHLPDSRFTKKLGLDLQKRFGGILKISPKLKGFDHQKSQKIYHLTVFYQKIPFKVGQIINYKGREVKIIKIGRKVLAKDLENLKQLTIDLTKMAKGKNS